MFLGSSAVERSTVNRLVAGSNPARGVSKQIHNLPRDLISLFFNDYNWDYERIRYSVHSNNTHKLLKIVSEKLV